MNQIKEVFEEKVIKQNWFAEKLSKSFSIGFLYMQSPPTQP
jgi:hypothetical protein